MPHVKLGMFLAGGLAVLGLGQAQADTSDASAKGTDQNPTATDCTGAATTRSTTTKHMEKHSTTKAAEPKSAPTTETTGGASGAVDDTGHTDSFDEPVAPANQGVADPKSNSEGTQGD